MQIALFTSPGMDSQAIASVLRAEGIDIVSCSVRPAGSHGDMPAKLDAAVLAVQTQGFVAIGEMTDVVRRAIGRLPRLFVCAPKVSALNRRKLKTCGASDVATPRNWEPDAVAERILAELILGDLVGPRALGTLRGGVQAVRQVYEIIDKVAPYSDPVLILGETGTGKELAAHEIHKRSGRPGDVLPIECGAVGTELLQSELFGHERGAFTGANEAHTGMLASAGSGTVFIDEIGDLTLAAQAKLLRALEERKIRPVGSNAWTDIEARLLFATNCELEEACAQGRFRRDLYARLSGLTIRMPPLRTRRADIPWLVHGFLDQFNEEHSARRTITPGSLDCLFRYDWPMNVRELRQVVRKAAILTPSVEGPISVAVLQEASRRRVLARHRNRIEFDPTQDSWKDVITRAWDRYSRAVLKISGNNKTAAAKRAGMSRSSFLEKCGKDAPATLPPSNGPEP